MPVPHLCDLPGSPATGFVAAVAGRKSGMPQTCPVFIHCVAASAECRNLRSQESSTPPPESNQTQRNRFFKEHPHVHIRERTQQLEARPARQRRLAPIPQPLEPPRIHRPRSLARRTSPKSLRPPAGLPPLTTNSPGVSSSAPVTPPLTTRYSLPSCPPISFGPPPRLFSSSA